MMKQVLCAGDARAEIRASMVPALCALLPAGSHWQPQPHRRRRAECCGDRTNCERGRRPLRNAKKSGLQT